MITMIFINKDGIVLKEGQVWKYGNQKYRIVKINYHERYPTVTLFNIISAEIGVESYPLSFMTGSGSYWSFVSESLDTVLPKTTFVPKYRF